jgi:hypothetical protein
MGIGLDRDWTRFNLDRLGVQYAISCTCIMQSYAGCNERADRNDSKM